MLNGILDHVTREAVLRKRCKIIILSCYLYCIAKCDGWKITPSQVRGKNSNLKPNPQNETSAYTNPYVKKRWFMPRLRGKHRDVDQN